MNLRARKGRIRGLARGASHRRALQNRQRSLRLEALEPRALLTSYTYPYGATPDDTGEYMMGDVAVNVVLMESDPSLAPYDNNSSSDPVHPGINAPIEDWTASEIAAVRSNVTAGLQWWKDTLAHMFPSAPADLLNFEINWQYADNPVHTGYEPIARPSNDFGDTSTAGNEVGWLYDFLHQVHFDATGNFSADLRSFNDYTRQQAGTDWSFTIFIVNNANDPDKMFASNGDFQRAYSYGGGRFMVVPADRPDRTYAHETGHQFWAFDEYLGGASYANTRGYYNTQNLNAADNPAPGFVQAPSIMLATDDTKMIAAYNTDSLDPYTMGTVGWQDSDGDGLFDALDVPFSLSGYGQYNSTTGNYEFRGSTHVNTLPNRNPSGTQDDIQIDQIGVVEASIDGGSWQTVASYPARTYQTDVSVDIPLGGGIHDIQIRSRDPRMATEANTNGAISNVFEGETDGPTQDDGQGVSGVVFLDANASGNLDYGEKLEPDVGLEVLDELDAEINLMHVIEPSNYAQGTPLNHVDDEPTATLSAIGGGKGFGDVLARSYSAVPVAGKVFSGTDILNNPWYTWNTARQLRVDFDSPVSTVSLRAYASAAPFASIGRLEAYTADNKLVARFTTGALSIGSFTTMNVSRPQGDIDHVIAYGRIGSNVILDTLQWGPAASSTTNSQGAYSLDYLPDGTYHIHLSPPAGYFITTPTQGYATVTVMGGRTNGSVNFGIAPDGTLPPPTHYAFHNYADPYNVDNDVNDLVTPADALTVISHLNAGRHGGLSINTAQDPNLIGFIDVVPDGLCTPADALEVINILNSRPRSGMGGAGTTTAPPGSSGGTSGEGEIAGLMQVQVPRSAADYYAQNPVHLLNIPGTDQPCTCSVCVAARVSALGQMVSATKTEESVQSLAVDAQLTSSDLLAGSKASPSAISSNTMLSRIGDTGWQRSESRLMIRKQTLPSAEPLSQKLEQALEEIAADVSQAETSDFNGAA